MTTEQERDIISDVIRYHHEIKELQRKVAELEWAVRNLQGDHK